MNQLENLLPAEVEGWSRYAAPASYDRQTIFDYIDGAGEVYLQFGFTDCLVQLYARNGVDTLVVEIFDMGSSQDAYGIFSYIREAPDVGIGQGSQRVGSVLHFWRDRYFVAVYPEQPSEQSKAVALEIGKAVSGLIGKDGKRPAILALLPDVGIDKLSIRYFHQYASLNYHYYLASDNILNLSPTTDAVLARESGNGAYLLIVEYENDAAAQQSLESFLDSYLKVDSGEAAELEPGKWSLAEVAGRYLIAVFESQGADSAKNLAAQVVQRIATQNSDQE